MPEIALESTAGAQAKAAAAAAAAIAAHKADAAAHPGYLRRFLTTTPSPFADPKDNLAGANLVIRGVDPTTGTLLGYDFTAGQLKQTTNLTFGWSTSKGLPAGSTQPSTPTNAAGGFVKFLPFNGYWYTIGRDTASGLMNVYRAPFATGGTAFTWTSVLVLTAGSSALAWCLTATSTTILVGEYGDPLTGGVKDPHIWRSTNGTTWTVALALGSDSAGNAYRHVHAVAADPRVDGRVIATIGDTGRNSIRISHDHGATWSTVNETGNWQCTQASFSPVYPDYVFLAPDNAARGASMFVLDLADSAGPTPKCATKDWHHNIAVPGAASGDRFNKQCYIGAVDPTTGVYYFLSNEPSAGGNVYGLFAVLEPGDRIQIIQSPAATFTDTNQPQDVVIFNGNLHYGAKYRPLLNAQAVPPADPGAED